MFSCYGAFVAPHELPLTLQFPTPLLEPQNRWNSDSDAATTHNQCSSRVHVMNLMDSLQIGWNGTNMHYESSMQNLHLTHYSNPWHNPKATTSPSSPTIQHKNLAVPEAHSRIRSSGEIKKHGISPFSTPILRIGWPIKSYISNHMHSTLTLPGIFLNLQKSLEQIVAPLGQICHTSSTAEAPTPMVETKENEVTEGTTRIMCSCQNMLPKCGVDAWQIETSKSEKKSKIKPITTKRSLTESIEAKLHRNLLLSQSLSTRVTCV